MVDALEIRVLGPFEVSTGGRPVAVTGGKRDALLALLALRRGRVVTVEELVDALWAADLPAAPRNAVQHHVARLRASLGHAAIVAAPDGYALADARVDALQFEELLGGGARRAARGRCARGSRVDRLGAQRCAEARRCRGSPRCRGSAARLGGSRACVSTRSRSSSRRRSRSAIIARSCRSCARHSRRIRSASVSGGS